MIEIGGVNYKIVKVKDLQKNEDCYGRTLPGNLTIEIDVDMPDDRTTQTINHEIIHAILCEYKFMEQYSDEKLVQALAVEISRLYKLREDKK
jgi:hypothetical protein